MDKISDILDSVISFVSEMKILFIGLGALAAVAAAALVVVPALTGAGSDSTPVASVSAQNSQIYATGTEIKNSDFKVTAKHQDGGTTELEPEEFTVSRRHVKSYGKTTPVTVTLKSNKKISCTVNVKNVRSKIVSFECGSEKSSDVKAVLYSNGELCFEGKGDIASFNDGSFPWKDYEGKDDNPIKSITFSKGVAPVSLDSAFSGIETLTYVSKIPSSVQSMIGTFNGCAALPKTADWSECNALLNISEAYSGCSALKYVHPLPSAVFNAESAFSGCSVLRKVPDMSKAVRLVQCKSMFENCEKMVSAGVPPKAKDLESIFAGCINLRIMPSLPKSSIKISSAFSGCSMLQTPSDIPKNVTEMGGCFSSCTMLGGEMTIRTKTESYDGMFSDACRSSQLNLKGSSPYLNEIALTADSGNVFVRGKKAVEKES